MAGGRSRGLYRRRVFFGEGSPPSVLGLSVMQNSDSGALLAPLRKWATAIDDDDEIVYFTIPLKTTASLAKNLASERLYHHVRHSRDHKVSRLLWGL